MSKGGPFALAIIVVLTLPASSAEMLDVYFLDVGQGDAILIDYGEFEVLIDGGPDGSCVEELRSLIDGRLEFVVATHPHSDHVGGLDDVLRAFAVASVVTNGQRAGTNAYLAFRASVDAEGCGERIVRPCERLAEVGDLVIDVIGPFHMVGDANEDSVVLYLHFGSVDFLFTGDIGFDAEATLLSLGVLQPIEVLKVAHHGSRYATGTEFLTTTQPMIAVYSAGVGNRYGHPADEAISRLEASGAEIYGTDECGAIRVSSDGTSCFVYSSCGAHSTQAAAQPTLSLATGLLINEVEMNPPGGDSGAEWIEIYNPTTQAVSLAGWAASYTGYGGGWDPIAPVTVQPGSHYVFVYPKQHLENSRAETIQLRNAAGEIVDATPSGLTDQEDDPQTWQRIPNGSDSDSLADWIFASGTPGTEN